jgi:hypothetical protein
MASEDFHRPGEASWSVDEIRYDEIERDRIKEDTQLLYLLFRHHRRRAQIYDASRVGWWNRRPHLETR